MSKKPNIRFKGFSDDWEQRKLIDYLEVSSEKNRDNRFTKEDVLSVSGEYGIVNQIEFQGRSFAGASVSNYGVVENGDVVYTKSPLKSNPYGIIKTNKGIPGIVSTLYAVYKPKEITDSKFVQIYFELDSRMNSYMHPLVNKGAKNDMKVSAENALKGMVSFPKKDEQEMISLYFSTLDHLITLHQCKCDKLKELKKHMLKKMFPKNNEKFPEYRFDGFTDPWEQRKLNEIADKVSEKNKNNEFSEPFTNSAEQGIVSQKDYFDREIVNNENLDGYYIVRNDDFIYNPRISVTAPVGPINRNRLGRNGVMSPLYTVFRTHDIDNLYLEFYFKTTKWHCFMKLNGDSGARFDRFTISSTQFMKMPIPYPTLEEQRKIGKYFDSLDDLITLHQRKVDNLKIFKKFMLKKMFV